MTTEIIDIQKDWVELVQTGMDYSCQLLTPNKRVEFLLAATPPSTPAMSVEAPQGIVVDKVGEGISSSLFGQGGSLYARASSDCKLAVNK